MKKIAADDWMRVFLEQLEKGKEIQLSPTGYSMYPFLISKRDSVILEKIDRPLKRGDICLYRRENGLHILHTVYRVKEDGVYFTGDSQTEIEGPLAPGQILAVANTIIRKKRRISCASASYRFLHGFWMLIRPFRMPLIRLWMKIRRLTGEERREREQKGDG